MAQSEPNISTLPQPLCFCFFIKSIEPDYGIQARLQTQPANPLWVPPTKMDAFKNRGITGWYSWRDGEVQKVANTDVDTHLRLHRTTSMFWCADRQAFLHVPYDCTRVNVGIKRDGVPLKWERLSFHHKEFKQAECISLVGYRYEKNELGAEGSPAWVPELIPSVYQLHKPSEYQQCHLAGDLSVLIALAAFSTVPADMVATIRDSFRRRAGAPTTEWRLHGRHENGSKHY
jgi:hypothetical protein